MKEVPCELGNVDRGVTCWNMNSPTVATGIQSGLSTFCIPLASAKSFKSPFFKVSMYSTELMLPFSKAKSGPTLLPAKQPHSIIVLRFPLKRGVGNPYDASR